MGKRGPQPTPTAVLKRRGSWRADKRNPKEPTSTGRPRCPSWVSPYAKRVWKRIIPQLDDMGVLGKIDHNALARYVEDYARWRDAILYIRKHGETYMEPRRDGNSVPQQRPESRLANQLDAALAKHERAFGLTPSARASLGMEMQGNGGGEADGKRRFFVGAAS